MTTPRTILVLAAAALAACRVGAAENYRNPVINENLADPAVIRHDGVYYLFATGEVHGDSGCRVYTSGNLVNWERGPVVFQPGQPHVWAPDVWRDPSSGRFYLLWARFICLDPLQFDEQGWLQGQATRGTEQLAPAVTAGTDLRPRQDGDPKSREYEQDPRSSPAASTADRPQHAVWQVAKAKQPIHRFSTLITAQQVRNHLGTDEGIDEAIDWCKNTGVTKVYVETFRSGYLAPRETLRHARERFLAAGFDVSGCVTTTIVGKKSTGWNLISCYTDSETQNYLREIFEYTAELFDEIMIDDFWFTDCQCSECEAARQAKTVTIGDKKYSVAGDTWEDYRCELMVQLSRHRVLAAAKRVNPKATLIIKYPQWYDRFHERGYEVLRETEDFDRIWVGTETRDYEDARWGGTPQYEAFFLMRWLGGIGGEKCGGGWFDPYGTTEKTYVEQARQTVLAGAKESLLFCYGSLLKDTGPANVRAFRPCIPELLHVAEQISRRQMIGVAAYKPPNSHPEKEPRVFDFVGMMGLPLVPCHQFPEDAQAAFFSVHALKDPNLTEKLSALIARGIPILVTDGLAQRLEGRVQLDASNVHTLTVGGNPKSLLELPQADLDAIRQPLLKPLGPTFKAPNRVALYLFSDGSWVIENFRDDPATVQLGDVEIEVAPREWQYTWNADASGGKER